MSTQCVTLTRDITVELVRCNASDQQVADAARVSTLGEAADLATRPIGGLIRRLMQEKHGSPFEHNDFGFRVTAPVDMLVEHLRHRVGWSYNGESARYKVMEPTMYCPPVDRPLQQVGKPMDYELLPGTPFQQEAVRSSFQRVGNEAFAEYQYLLEIGVAKEVARFLLPSARLVTYYTSCNARSLMAFLSLRTSYEDAAFPSKPQWEIEEIALQYEKHFQRAMPLTHQAYVQAKRVAP